MQASFTQVKLTGHLYDSDKLPVKSGTFNIYDSNDCHLAQAKTSSSDRFNLKKIYLTQKFEVEQIPLRYLTDIGASTLNAKTQIAKETAKITLGLGNYSGKGDLFTEGLRKLNSVIVLSGEIKYHLTWGHLYGGTLYLSEV
jgi:hypothetical protein